VKSISSRLTRGIAFSFAIISCAYNPTRNNIWLPKLWNIIGISFIKLSSGESLLSDQFVIQSCIAENNKLSFHEFQTNRCEFWTCYVLIHSYKFDPWNNTLTIYIEE
jgi:hypothetical protein